MIPGIESLTNSGKMGGDAGPSSAVGGAVTVGGFNVPAWQPARPVPAPVPPVVMGAAVLFGLGVLWMMKSKGRK